jgi:uncharacterized protein (DUF433 family)
VNTPRRDIEIRNAKIIVYYTIGLTRKQLARKYHLTYDCIKKILRYVERRALPRH